jgi:F-type H+-transporting ATPase subunit b
MSRLFAVTLMALLPRVAQAVEGHGEGIPTKALVFAAVNFFLLIGVLAYFLRKPTKEFFASRSELIKTEIQEVQSLKEEARRKYAEYDARLKGIAVESKALIAELKKDGELERTRIIQEAEAQARSLQEVSSRIMSQEVRRAKEELKREAVALAGELAEELIRKNMTAEDQKRIVNEYLSKMEKIS